MAKNIKINVHHVTRVEGHGNILVKVRNGKIEQCQFEVIEAPRYFESMLRDQPYGQVAHLVSRICGICSVTHTTTSNLAVERALGIEVSEQVQALRMLNLFAEMIDSHVLHAYMLVAPDLFGTGSVIPLVKTSRPIVERALRMKKVAGDICAVIAGRHTHPIALQVGGITHLPTLAALEQLLCRLQNMRVDLDDTVEMFHGCGLPEFERETEYLALGGDQNYSLISNSIISSVGESWPVEMYQQVTNEYIMRHSTAKHASTPRSSYMVGALARFNINYPWLHPKAKSAATMLGIQPICHKPYWITLAQIVELVHFCEAAIELLHGLLERGIRPEGMTQPTRWSGVGIGACEAPRGTLYHHYELHEGTIVWANCVIPTAQNLANIEADMHVLVPVILDNGREEITQQLEMLVRAYDPCISCSTHMIRLSIDDHG